MGRFLKYGVSLVLIHIVAALWGQPVLPLHNYYTRQADFYFIENQVNYSTFLKPYSRYLLNAKFHADSVFTVFGDSVYKKNWFARKLFYEHFYQIDSAGFSLSVDPVFNLQYGKDLQTNETYKINTRGINVNAEIGPRLSFESSFYENQAFFPAYYDTLILNTMVVPGQGYAREFKKTGWDYNYSNAEVWYKASSKLNVAMGLGKNFIGDGYRSLLLSDNSYNYPFLKFMYSGETIHYTRIYEEFMDVNKHWSPFGVDKKLAGFNVLSFTPKHWFEFSVFEGNIWEYPNKEKRKYFDCNYLNPVILVNSIAQPKNVNEVLGLGLRINILRTLQFYSQASASNFSFKNISKGMGSSASQYGLQIGGKYFNAFSLNGLYLQYEMNVVRPYTYSYSNSHLSYSHYNQALTHPLGANFIENVFIAQYKIRSLFFEGQLNLSKYGKSDAGENVGNNIFDTVEPLEADNNQIFQGTKVSLQYIDLKVSYLLNPKTNMNLVLGYIQREITQPANNTSLQYWYIGFRTSLQNFYYDY
jgi:hypothetical protein